MRNQTTKIKDDPFIPPNTPKQRKRRGIGDNSESAPDHDQDISLEMISKNLSAAQLKAAEYDDAWKSCTAGIEKKGCETISAIYVVARQVHAAGAYDQIMAAYGITIHGNTRNLSQPIVSICFLTLDHPPAKSTASKWSTVIDHGVVNGLSPEQFTELVSASGIENLYKNCKPSTRKDPLTEQQHEELAKAAFPDRTTDAPVCSDPELLGNRSGDRLAVVRGDGRGNFSVRAILDHAPLEVTRFLSAIALKRLAR
jgi:hypothetical protein